MQYLGSRGKLEPFQVIPHKEAHVRKKLFLVSDKHMGYLIYLMTSSINMFTRGLFPLQVLTSYHIYMDVQILWAYSLEKKQKICFMYNKNQAM